MGVFVVQIVVILGSVDDNMTINSGDIIKPMKFQDKCRMGQVTRFHMVRTYREQTMAEHCYLVAVIAEELAKAVMIPETGNVIKLALMHDRHEVITGDIPTPFKKDIDKNSDYNFLELVEKVDPNYMLLRRDMSLSELVVVEMADMIEAVIFLEKEGIDSHASRVRQYIFDKLWDLIEIMDNKHGSNDKWAIAVSMVTDKLREHTTVSINES